MLKFIKKSILESKQKQIRARFPNVNMILHPEMPNPSVNKMVELAEIVSQVNSLESKVSALSDEALRQ